MDEPWLHVSRWGYGSARESWGVTGSLGLASVVGRTKDGVCNVPH